VVFVEHISEDLLELYSLGRLEEPQLAPVEEHLLICHDCLDRVEQMDEYVAALRAVLRKD
jgi:anti-sigma factor RsiW